MASFSQVIRLSRCIIKELDYTCNYFNYLLQCAAAIIAAMEDDPIRMRARIEELEIELSERESDLAQYRTELTKANAKLERLIDQISQELKSAHLIQKLLLPTEFSNIPGFEFSTQFIPSMISGGDYFDIFEHDDRLRFGIVVASSSGHAMSALFLSVLLKLTGQMEARKGAEPHVVLSKFAQELVPNIEGDAAASVLYAVMDRRRYDMAICRTGDVIALHQDAQTGVVRTLEGQTPKFTANFQAKLQSQIVSLNPRDRLIFCTTGLTDITNAKGESFGIERLVKTVLRGPRDGVHQLRNHIVFTAQKYGGNQELKRDLTLVVLEVKDRVIKLAKK